MLGGADGTADFTLKRELKDIPGKAGDARTYRALLVDFVEKAVAERTSALTETAGRTLKTFLTDRSTCSALPGTEAERVRSASEQVWAMLDVLMHKRRRLTIRNAYALCSFVGELRSLRRLTLEGHPEVSVRLPSDPGDLSALSDVDLSNSRLEDVSSMIRALGAVSYLNLSRNRLIRLPEEVGNLTWLWDLDVSRNLLVVFPEWVGKLTLLWDLNMSRNRLNSSLAGVENLRCLRCLNLSHNRLRVLSEKMGELRCLQSLDVSYNRLEALPSTMGSLRHLEYVNAGHNRLDALPATMGDLQPLREVCLRSNLFDTFPQQLAYLNDPLDINIGDFLCVTLFSKRTLSDNPIYVDLGDNPLLPPDCPVFDVHSEDIVREPFAILERLSSHLDRRRRCPVVRYTDAPHTDAPHTDVLDIDTGGLMRDLITRLFLAISPGKGGDVPLPRCGRGGSPNTQLNRGRCLLIGKLFGATFLKQSGILTGNRFHPLLFRMIGLLGKEHMETIREVGEPIDESVIDLLLSVYMEGTVWDANPTTIVARKELTSWLLGGDVNRCLDISPTLQALYAYAPDDSVTKKAFLDELDNGQFNESVLAVRYIAKGMYDYVGEEHWNCVREQSEEGELQATVEGCMSKERIKAEMETNAPGARSYRYLIRWIEERDDETLRDFLRCVTGSRTLPPGTSPLHIEIYDEGKRLPFFWTCFRQMVLPTYGKRGEEDEETYRSFVHKMSLSMEYALAGPGFTSVRDVY